MKFLKLPPINRQQLKNNFKGQLLISLLALSLTTSLILGSVLPSYTQTPAQLTSRNEVVEKIKQAAERHVDGDSAMQTSTVVNAFKDNQVGLAEAEILEIYETEYARLKAIKDSSFWEQARPNAGWVVAILLGLLALFRNTLEGWISGAIKALGEGIYIRVGGRWLLQGLALRRYQKALFNKHKELHIPFRANHPLDMEKVYIPLKTEGSARGEQIDADQAITRYKRLMVTGPPGGGKSMLLKHTAFTYSTGHLTLSSRPTPILVELHRFDNPELTQDALVQAFVDALSRDDFPKAERFVQHSLAQGTLLLLLDGLDEVNSEVRPGVVRAIKDLLDTFEDCHIVITCRTAVYRDEFANVTEQTLKVSEFSDQQIRRFLRAWEKEIRGDKSVEQLLQTLQNRPRIVELARNPLLLTIIAHLYSDPSFVLPYSRTEFYQKSTSILLEQWDKWRGEFNKEKAIDKRRILQHLALFSQTQANKEQGDRRRVDRYTVLQEIRKILPALNLNPDEKTEPILEEIVERSGLLLVVDGGAGYKFSHLTLQEYFTAEALKENPGRLIDYFKQAPDEWREVIKLWCGFGSDSTTLIQTIFETDTVTGFECLADAQEINPRVAESIITPFKVQLGINGPQDQITSAFGAVAADFRPRGKAIFEFLTNILDNSQESSRRQAAAEALSKTNLPQAASILGKHYGKRPEVRVPLIRMGNLAVPILAQLADQKLPALKDIFLIGTPEAAVALVPFLWSQKRMTPHKQYLEIGAAWCLAGLTLQRSVEEVLRAYELTAEQQSASSLTWVWQPFDEPQSSSLPIIAGRIAYQIANAPNAMTPDSLKTLDPRIVIPLCAISLRSQASIPNTWPQKAATLLEQPVLTPELEAQTNQIIRTLLSNSENNSRWMHLFSSLTPKLQLNLLYRLIAYHPPNQNDWRYIFRMVDYEFRTQWQYRCVLLIAAAASIMAIIEMGMIALQHPDSPFIGLLGLALVVVLVFWESLRKGIEKPFEPNTFLRLSLLGPLTFRTELRQLFQSQLVWPGIEALFNALHSAGAFVGTVAITVAAAGTAAGTATGTVAVAITVVSTGTVAFIVTAAFASAGAVAVTVVSTGTGTIAFVGTFSIIGAGAFAGAGAGAFAGIGLGTWHRFKSRPNERIPQFFAVLAFPWFCWFPIVITFSTLGLQNFFPSTRSSVTLFNIVILCLCRGLWWHGQRSEARARNPLKGIIEPESSLRV